LNAIKVISPREARCAGAEAKIRRSDSLRP